MARDRDEWEIEAGTGRVRAGGAVPHNDLIAPDADFDGSTVSAKAAGRKK